MGLRTLEKGVGRREKHSAEGQGAVPAQGLRGPVWTGPPSVATVYLLLQ